MNEQRFTLDVSKEPAVLPVLYLGQGDKNGTTLVAELYDNGVALSASGYVPSFEMRLPGGKAYYKVDGTLSGNVATIPIDETYAAAVAGRACTAYVSLKSGSNVVSTTRMNVAVLESATNDVNPGQAYENGIEQAIADAESRIASAASSAASQVAQAQEQATAAIAQAQADQQQAADELEAAIDALGDISEVAVPLMTQDIRGGAKLGDGLKVDDGALSLGDVVTDAHDGPIYSARGEGWSEQDTTTGKNLFNVNGDHTLSANTTAEISGESVTVKTTDATGYRSSAWQFQISPGSYTASFVSESANALLRIDWYETAGGASIDHISLVGNSRQATFSIPANASVVEFTLYARRTSSGSANDSVTYSNIQLEAGSTATSYEPYTGGAPSPSPDYPQKIRVARGRNLLPIVSSETKNGITFTTNADGSTTISGTASGSPDHYFLGDASNYVDVGIGRFTLYGCTSGSSSTYQLFCITKHSDNTTHIRTQATQPITFDLASGDTVRVFIRVASGATVNATVYQQFELGSTPTPYVPYGHVGLEVRDSSDELVSVTPIPLPAKGFAAALPNGTADMLSVDSAGRYEWTDMVWLLEPSAAKTIGARPGTQYVTFTLNQSFFGINGEDIYCTHGIGALNADTVGNCYLTSYGQIALLTFQNGSFASVAEASAWAAANKPKFYYLLATPTTEHGYIDLPNVPEGSTITIPELDDVGIRCFVNGARELAEHADNWGARCKENESRIAALEAAIAEIATA